jgi:hypothetical protein
MRKEGPWHLGRLHRKFLTRFDDHATVRESKLI